MHVCRQSADDDIDVDLWPLALVWSTIGSGIIDRFQKALDVASVLHQFDIQNRFDDFDATEFASTEQITKQSTIGLYFLNGQDRRASLLPHFHAVKTERRQPPQASTRNVQVKV